MAKPGPNRLNRMRYTLASMEPLHRQDEAKRILQAYPDAAQRPVLELLERQFTVLANRAQVLLGLCGIIVTTTGFSGRLIAGTNRLAQGLIIGGVSLTLFSAVVAVTGVLSLRWITQQPGDSAEAWLDTMLAYRDRKARCYHWAIALLMLGLALYVAALALMLVYPTAAPSQPLVR